ncbi:unnamed protein product [Ectocarpus sp. 4 AP-2014]
MKNVEGSFPGDFTLGGNSFGSSWDAMSEETQASKRAIELNNGRAAQMGILALMVQAVRHQRPPRRGLHLQLKLLVHGGR